MGLLAPKPCINKETKEFWELYKVALCDPKDGDCS